MQGSDEQGEDVSNECKARISKVIGNRVSLMVYTDHYT